MDKKGAGMILPIIIGIAFLITTTIIAFVVVQNVATVESDTASYATQYIVNESGWVNSSAYTLTRAGLTGFQNPAILKIYNLTAAADPLVLAVENATVTNAGVVKNSSKGYQCNSCSITYSYQFKETTISSESMRNNFTAGVTNVANKIPTVLLIIAVVLVLGVLALLWQQYKKMGVGGDSEGGI